MVFDQCGQDGSPPTASQVHVCARPELNESVLYPRELDAVEIASCSVMLVALRVLVGVAVPDEREIVGGAQMERVLPARRVCLGVVSRPKHDVLDETSFNVRTLEERL